MVPQKQMLRQEFQSKYLERADMKRRKNRGKKRKGCHVWELMLEKQPFSFSNKHLFSYIIPFFYKVNILNLLCLMYT